MRGFLIAGTHSGVGKTSVVIGLLRALSRRGHRVQPFKAGPDYIDPSYHATACGVSSRTLDAWLLEPSIMRALFQRAMRGKDLAIVEGMMGLYDGCRGDAEDGSTAHVAKLLGLPVILVVDAQAATRSVGATVLGFQAFDPKVNLVGVILNGIAGERHLEFIKPSLAAAGVPLLGYLPRRSDLALPERYLGLIPASEGHVAEACYGHLADQVESTCDLDRLLSIAASFDLPTEEATIFPTDPRAVRTAIAIARDEAFNFYYPDALELLEAWGAELIPFSPLRDSGLPHGIGGVVLGGGFPELYAEGLSQNMPMRQALRRAAEAGLPIYAECGGLMYLGQRLEGQEGRSDPMVGILPTSSSLLDTQLTLGYRTICALHGHPFIREGDTVRGHEFHLSALTEPSQVAAAAYRVLDQSGRLEGFRMKNVIASYIHLHLASRSDLAPRFVNWCAEWHADRGRHRPARAGWWPKEVPKAERSSADHMQGTPWATQTVVHSEMP